MRANQAVERVEELRKQIDDPTAQLEQAESWLGRLQITRETVRDLHDEQPQAAGENVPPGSGLVSSHGSLATPEGGAFQAAMHADARAGGAGWGRVVPSRGDRYAAESAAMTSLTSTEDEFAASRGLFEQITGDLGGMRAAAMRMREVTRQLLQDHLDLRTLRET